MAQRIGEREFRLWAALHEASHAITRLRDQELRRVGVTRIQNALLFTIKAIRDRPATPAEISRRISREEQTVSVSLRQMEKKGLIGRVRDLERKNMFRVVLTEKGEEALTRGLARREVIPDIMSHLTEEEQDALGELVEKLRSVALERLGVNHVDRIWRLPHKSKTTKSSSTE